MAKTGIPIFASVSELTLNPEKWISTCKEVQYTGVSGIQLDLFYFENVIGESDFTQKFVELLCALKDALTIPIFPKLNINLPTALFQGKMLMHYNGDTVYQHPILVYNETKCTHYRKCLEQAFCTAITENNRKVTIDNQLCDGCSLCTDLCPSNALFLLPND